MKLLLLALLLPTVALSDPLFQDRSAALPLEHVYSGGWEHFVGGGVAVFDCNGDAYPEVFAAGGQAPAHLFRNTAQGPGAPLTFALGDIPDLTGVTGAYPVDIDGDGHLDLMVLRVGPNRLLKGGPDCSFTDATKAWGFQTGDRWTTAFSATWEPGQTLPTLAIGNYVDRTNPDGPFEACDVNLLYRPFGTRYSQAYELKPGFCALSMLFSDWSRQGRADLRVSNDRHYYVRGGSEQMWRMDPLRLLGPDDAWQPVSIWGMGIASQDLNGDLKPDVMLTSMGDQLLQFATPHGFENAPFAKGATAHRPHTGDDGRPSTGWHAAFGDADNDGIADIFIAKGNVDQMPDNAMHDPNNLLMGQADGTYLERAAKAGIATTSRSRGAALVDLNADGLLDLVVMNRRAPMELWQNVSRDTGNWIAVSLSQPAPNVNGVGAWVEVRDASGHIRTSELTVGGGHASGTAAPLHFGLGSTDKVEVRAIWPDGTASPWLQARANQPLTISRRSPGQ